LQIPVTISSAGTGFDDNVEWLKSYVCCHLKLDRFKQVKKAVAGEECTGCPDERYPK
jgi:hypothetical protein